MTDDKFNIDSSTIDSTSNDDLADSVRISNHSPVTERLERAAEEAKANAPENSLTTFNGPRPTYMEHRVASTHQMTHLSVDDAEHIIYDVMEEVTSVLRVSNWRVLPEYAHGGGPQNFRVQLKFEPGVSVEGFGERMINEAFSEITYKICRANDEAKKAAERGTELEAVDGEKETCDTDEMRDELGIGDAVHEPTDQGRDPEQIEEALEDADVDAAEIVEELEQEIERGKEARGDYDDEDSTETLFSPGDN